MNTQWDHAEYGDQLHDGHDAEQFGGDGGGLEQDVDDVVGENGIKYILGDKPAEIHPKMGAEGLHFQGGECVAEKTLE